MRIDTFYQSETKFAHLSFDPREGVRANFDMQAHSLVCQVKGLFVTRADLLSMGKMKPHCLQVDDDRYIDPEYPFYLFSHSCNPNCGINSQLQLVTIKDVSKGDLLCWDYSTAMFERNWKIKCNCGDRSCRQTIVDFTLLPDELRDRYRQQGIVLPFFLKGLSDKSS
jgi:hypothetical protein